MNIDKIDYELTEKGDLIVNQVDQTANGNYTCRASNIAGVRETPIAKVYVWGKSSEKFKIFNDIFYQIKGVGVVIWYLSIPPQNKSRAVVKILFFPRNEKNKLERGSLQYISVANYK